jgi:hypothetical protein
MGFAQFRKIVGARQDFSGSGLIVIGWHSGKVFDMYYGFRESWCLSKVTHNLIDLVDGSPTTLTWVPPRFTRRNTRRINTLEVGQLSQALLETVLLVSSQSILPEVEGA